MTKKETPQTIEECNAELELTQKKSRQYENRSKMLDRRHCVQLDKLEFRLVISFITSM